MVRDDDLEINRQGRIAESQRQQVLAAVRLGAIGWFEITAWIVFLIAWIGTSVIDPVGGEAGRVVSTLSVSPLLVFVTYRRAVRPLLLRARATRDLARGVVANGEGSVSFRRNRYVATLRGQRGALFDTFAIEPGEYLFYYLPQSRWILSAERRSSEAVSLRVLRDAIARTIGGLHRSLRTHIVLAVVFAAMAILAAWPYIDGRFQLDSRGIVDGPVSFGVVFAAIALWLIVRCAREVSDLNAAPLVIEGPVTRRVDPGYLRQIYYLDVASHSFKMSEGTYNAVIDDMSYRVAVAPHSRQIMSIEPVGESEAGERASWAKPL